MLLVRLLRAFLALCCLTTSVAAEAPVSGQPLVLWEMQWERVTGEENLQLVIRALGPEVADRGYDDAALDMVHLCEVYGAPMITLPLSQATKIVVNIADRPVPRGVTDSEATQFFETFQVVDGLCEISLF